MIQRLQNYYSKMSNTCIKWRWIVFMVLLLTASANSSLSDNKVQQYNVGYEIGRSDQELKICNVYSEEVAADENESNTELDRDHYPLQQCAHGSYYFLGMVCGSVLTGVLGLGYLYQYYKQGKLPLPLSAMKEKNTNAMQHNAAGTATETNPDDIPLQQSSLLLRKGDIEQDENVFQFDYKTLLQNCRELESSSLLIGAPFDKGEFGDVCAATFSGSGLPKTVFVKTLDLNTCPSTSAGSKSISEIKLDFLKEAFVMCQLQHENVISLVGITTSYTPVSIVMEYAENGPLDKLLATKNGAFDVFCLQKFMQQIASGMNYLSANGYVHRCLAASNILVNNELVCKISKFKTPSKERIKNEMMNYTPWTAPEVYAFGEHSKASDVWSFGVVCWEILSNGEKPYSNWASTTIIEYVRKGYRMKIPYNCSKNIANLIMACWEEDYKMRPTFDTIAQSLTEYCDQIRIAVELHKVFEWLEDLGMTCHIPLFLRGGFINELSIQALTMDDLARMEIPANAREVIMESIPTKNVSKQSTRIQIAV